MSTFCICAMDGRWALHILAISKREYALEHSASQMQMAFWFPFEAAGLESMGSRLHWLPLLKKVSPRLPRGAKSVGLSSQLMNMPENQGMSYRTVSTLSNYVHDLLVDQNPLSPVAVLDRSKWHQPVTLDAAPSSSRRLHG